MRALLSAAKCEIPSFIFPSSIIHHTTLPIGDHKFPIFSHSKPFCAVGEPPPKHFHTVVKSQLPSNPVSISEENDDEPESMVQDLRVPDQWLHPSKAMEESKWLRVTLHKWLDDEYCPEETNVEISKVAAHSYYKSLLDRQTDIGEILLMMARELESISYKESFHGAFSSANAAVNLIVQRIELEGTMRIGLGPSFMLWAPKSGTKAGFTF